MHGVIKFAEISSLESEGNSVHSSFEFSPPIKHDSCFEISATAKNELRLAVCLEPNDSLQKDTLIAGFIEIDMTTTQTGNAKVHTTMKVVPVVCYFEHKASFTASKSLSFGEVAVGLSRTESFIITNNSSTNSLVYDLAIQKLPLSPSANEIEIISDSSGTLGPNCNCVISVKYAAGAVGKFNGIIWISNRNDQFDQRRVVLSASSVVPPPKLVEFLELQPDSVDPTKYLPLDLGLIQINTTVKGSVPFSQQGKSDFVYVLHVRNVSPKVLLLSATSNLKSQCFIYSDGECTVPVQDCPLEPASLTSIYILIKPANAVAEIWEQPKEHGKVAVGSRNSLTLTPPTIPTGAVPFTTNVNDADVYAGSLTSRAQLSDADSTASGAITFHPAAGILTTQQSVSHHKSMIKGRTLLGGIRFVFHELMQSELSSSFGRAAIQDESTASAGRVLLPPLKLPTKVKLFETSITFKATIGFSLLKIFASESPCHYIRLASPVTQPNHQEPTFVKGSLVLQNLSPTFPLSYRISSRKHVACLGDLDCISSSDDIPECVQAWKPVNHIDVLLCCGAEGILAELGMKVISYFILFDHACVGFGSFEVEVLNVCTSISKSLLLFVQIDRGAVNCSFSEGATAASGTGVPKAVSDVPIWIAPSTQDAEFGANQAVEKSAPRDDDLSSLSRTSSKSFGSSTSSSTAANILLSDTPSSISSFKSNGALKTRIMQIIGSGRPTLAYLTVFNSTNRALALTPMCNLPLISAELISETEYQRIDNSKTSAYGKEKPFIVMDDTFKDISGVGDGTSEQQNVLNTDRFTTGAMQRLGRSGTDPISAGSGTDSSLPAAAAVSPNQSFESAGTILAPESFKKCGASVVIQAQNIVRMKLSCRSGTVISETQLTMLRADSKLFRTNSKLPAAGLGREDLSTKNIHGQSLSFRNVLCLLGFVAASSGNTMVSQPYAVSLSGKGKKSPSLSTLFVSEGNESRGLVSSPSPVLFQTSEAADATVYNNSNTCASARDAMDSPLLPLLSLCRLECSFFLPVLTVGDTNVDVGVLRSGRSVRIQLCRITNGSDCAVPISVSNIPRWITVEPMLFQNESQYNASLDSPVVDDVITENSTTMKQNGCKCFKPLFFRR
jgi:hypothetical protein